jgi:hypothetical protein
VDVCAEAVESLAWPRGVDGTGRLMSARASEIRSGYRSNFWRSLALAGASQTPGVCSALIGQRSAYLNSPPSPPTPHVRAADRRCGFSEKSRMN